MKPTQKKPGLVHTFLIGLMVLLPLALTIGLIGWVAGFFNRLMGPESIVGRVLVSLGLSLAGTRFTAYVAGAIMVLIAIYLLGLASRHGLQAPLQRLIQGMIRRIPVVGSVYDLVAKFVAMFDQNDEPALKSMTPVWCFMGGEGGMAFLALLPNPEPVQIEGQTCLGILVPSAPVPVGGFLVFVPAAWVKPATFGVEGLSSIYVSMGVTASSVLARATENRQLQPVGESTPPPAGAAPFQ